MSKEKQIEEVRKDIFAAFGGYAKWEEDWQSLAEAVYNAGYRKQEWISVEDRLPDLESTLIKWGDLGYKQKSIRVLCVCKQKSGKVLVKEGYYEVWTDSPTDPYWKIPGSIDSVTHWMPLPEPPKKGGAE